MKLGPPNFRQCITCRPTCLDVFNCLIGTSVCMFFMFRGHSFVLFCTYPNTVYEHL